MITLNKGLDAFLHSLIPSELQRRTPPNTAAYVRVRSLSAMLVLVTAISALTNLLVGGSHLLFQPDMLKYDLVSLAILLFLALQVALFYRFHNDWISGIAFTNFYFLIAAILVLLSGGYSSHGKAFLLSCPIISFLIGGRQEGIQNTIIVILVCWALAALHVLDFRVPNIFSGQSILLMFSVNWVTTMLIITAVLVVYETELCQRIACPKPRLQEEFVGENTLRIYARIDRIVPAEFRASLDFHSLAYMRIQVVTIMLLMGTLAASLMTVFFVTYHFLFDPRFLAQDSIAGLIALCFAIQLILLYRVHHYRLSSVMLSTFYSSMIFVLVIISGGYRSPFMILLLTCPIVAFMINGIYGGTVNAACFIVIGLLFAHLEFSGLGLVNRIDNLSEVLCFSIVWPLILAGIAVCMTLYDIALERP